MLHIIKKKIKYWKQNIEEKIFSLLYGRKYGVWKLMNAIYKTNIYLYINILMLIVMNFLFLHVNTHINIFICFNAYH